MYNGRYSLPECRKGSTLLLALRWACAWRGRAPPSVCACSVCVGATPPRPRHDLATTFTAPLRTAPLRTAPLRTSPCDPRARSTYVCHAHVRPPCTTTNSRHVPTTSTPHAHVRTPAPAPAPAPARPRSAAPAGEQLEGGLVAHPPSELHRLLSRAAALLVCVPRRPPHAVAAATPLSSGCNPTL